MSLILIGLTGAQGAGKDTVADILVSDYGFVKLAFADPLRVMANAIDPPIGVDGLGQLVTYREAVESLGYRAAKDSYPALRRFLERAGTEWGRDVMGEDYWLSGPRSLWLNGGAGSRVVIPDVRFDNEVAAIRDDGGRIVWVNRETEKPKWSHRSNESYKTIEYDFRVDNHTSLLDLESRVASLMSAQFQISRVKSPLADC